MVFERFLGKSKDGFWRILRNIERWFLKDFKEYWRIVFEGFLGISKDGFWRILRNIER
jgi:hypothetical protein